MSASRRLTLFLVEQDVNGVYGFYFTRAAVSARSAPHAIALTARYMESWAVGEDAEERRGEEGIDVPYFVPARVRASVLGTSRSRSAVVHVCATGRDDSLEPGVYS